MATFHGKDEFVNIFSTLWDEILDTPEIVTKVASEKLILKFRYTDLETDLYIDLTGDAPAYYWDPDTATGFDVEMIQSSETSHLFWMQKLNVPMALATRKVVAKGSVQKALKLLPALKPAFAMYPPVLKRLGREDLQRKAPKKKRKRAFNLFGRKRIKTYSMDPIPGFPLEYTEDKLEATEATVSPEAEKPITDMDLLETMYTIRMFEQHLADAFARGDLPTEAIHLSIGQEAVAAGVCLNLRNSDFLNTTHRGHGHIIAKGADIDRMMAELYGKADGLCRGKGGSMHVTDARIGVMGANGIVGAGYLLALGAGFSIERHEKSDDISVVIAGDGSVNHGMFHEAMNMIGLMKLPVLVVVENNGYGEFTPVERHSAVSAVAERAAAYGVEAVRLDGNNVRTVFAEVGDIVNRMRSDGKPRLVELMTWRWHGHMEGDPELYRDAEEKKRHMQDDPVQRLETELVREGVLDDVEIAAMKQRVEKRIDAAATFASEAEEPKEAALLTDIYHPEEKHLFTGSFDTGSNVEEMSVSGAINRALAEELARDERVFLWGEDITLGGYFNVTTGLVETFGNDRIIDTPISENGFVGGAVGAAMAGMRPVTEILFADFLTCCMDPIVNQAAKLRYMTGGQASVALTIRTPLGSGIGMAAQHSQSMESFFFGVPGLIVIAPSDAFTAMGLLKSAIRSNNPVLFFEHKLLYAESGKVPAGECTLPIGKARIVRPGSDVTLVTWLLGVGIARDAAELLAESGIDVEIVDLATLYPMDTRTILDSVAKTGRLVTLEEGTFSGSVGSEVIARTTLAGFDLLKRPPVKIAAPETPVPYAKNLENAMLPTAEKAARKIEAMMG